MISYPTEPTRGLKPAEQAALQALQLFLGSRGVVDIELEEKVPGYTLVAKDRMSKVRFSSWGEDIGRAVNNLIRSVSR